MATVKKEKVNKQLPDQPESVIKKEIEELKELKEELTAKKRKYVERKINPKGKHCSKHLKNTVVIRKKKIDSDEIDKITLSVKYAIIEDYINTGQTLSSLGDKYGISATAITRLVDRHYASLKNVKETKYLMQMPDRASKHLPANQRTTASRYKIYKLLFTDGSTTEEFLERISEEDSDVLTNYEASFCYNYIYSASEVEALEKSGLAVGLIKPNKEDDRAAYKQACRLRSYYLRRKPNIAREIKAIQESYLKQTGLAKEFIQSEYMREIEELREDKDLKARQLLSRNLELLGKTIPGTFAERIEVSEIDPAKAIDKLLEMAKAEVVELPAGAKTDESWELDQ